MKGNVGHEWNLLGICVLFVRFPWANYTFDYSGRKVQVWRELGRRPKPTLKQVRIYRRQHFPKD